MNNSEASTSTNVTSDTDRVRIAKACAACSRQKLRCDGEKPCTRCKTMGCTDQCIYLPSMRGKIKRKRVNRPSDSVTESDAHSVHRETPSMMSRHDQSEHWERKQSTTANNTALWDSNQSASGSFKSPESNILSVTSPEVMRRGSSSNLDKLTTTLPLHGDADNPLSVLVELSEVASTRHTREQSFSGADAKRRREEEEYYAPLERTLKEEAPQIMALINTHEAKQLFDVYFTHLHPYLPLLDKELSSPSAIARRNNFLFNAICCSAARSHNVVIWSRLRDFARFEMERLPREKNIDVVQGHLIYSWWNLIRPTRFEQDMTWLRAGIACRTAIDIALHRVGLLAAAREGLPSTILKSIVRTWLLCFVVDRTLCVQLGKPNGRQWELEATKYIDYLRGASGTEVQSTEDDMFVAALGEWALILSQAIDAFRLQALQTTGSYAGPYDLSTAFAIQLQQWRERAVTGWNSARKSRASSGDSSQFEVYEYYARLVIHSLALQHAQTVSPLSLPSTFIEYQNCAIHLLETISYSREISHHTRNLPDFSHTALTYAATSLLRCTQARFTHLNPDRQRIFSMARKAAVLLAEAAIDSDHIAAVQSALVSKLISIRDVNEPIGKDSNVEPTGISPTLRLNRPLEAVDFGYFARALNDDQNMSLWPPQVPESADSQRWFDQAGSTGPPLSEQGNTATDVSGDLALWASRQDLNMGNLGPGLDEFLTTGGVENGSFNDGAWQSLFSGQFNI